METISINFDIKDHLFFTFSNNQIGNTKGLNLCNANIKSLLNLYFQLNSSHKIIIHGLFDWRTITIIAFMPWLLKKCAWIIWGYDLYVYQKKNKNWKEKIKEVLKHFLIPKIRYLVTYIEGDYHLAKKWYRAKGQRIHCLMYPSNLFIEDYFQKASHTNTVKIMIGNSADPSNEHEEVLKSLTTYKDEDIQIYCILSYGDISHAKKITTLGQKIFGEKFVPILKMMDKPSYLKFLNEVDIAIFHHKRQQAMGNIIGLLGMGKKVYIRTGETHTSFFESLGARVYDLNHFDLTLKNESGNQKIIADYFSKENYLIQLNELLK
tara:strand:+ start:46 stop:1008 length:963 start_codon:yes stop_codon:yes gene_type:complete